MIEEEPATFAYDEVAYPPPVLPITTPDRLAAAGIMHGWRPPAPETASCLEIGCGDAFNLIGAAAVTPKGKFVGFDLSKSAVARGRDMAAAAGLSNVAIEVADILDYPREGEKFHYIVAHGVFTWVPQPVRTAMLDLIAKRLAPGGVAYVSFDALPAAAPKAYIHSFLMRELVGVKGFQARCQEAVRLLAMLARNQRSESRLKVQLDQLMEDLPDFHAGYFYHDWLAQFYAPVSLHDLGSEAAKNGLRRAGDPAMYDLYVGDLDEEARAMVEALGDDMARRSELVSALRGAHMFRREFLVHADAPPPPVAWSEGVRTLTFGFSGQREPLDQVNGPSYRYTYTSKYFVTPSEPTQIAIMESLHEAFPRELSFDELLMATQADSDVLAAALLNFGTTGIVEVHATYPRFVVRPGDNPRAGQLVRSMLHAGNSALSLRHHQVQEDNALSRQLITLCDGTRTRDEIVRAMAEIFDPSINREKIDAALTYFANHRLLEA